MIVPAAAAASVVPLLASGGAGGNKKNRKNNNNGNGNGRKGDKKKGDKGGKKCVGWIDQANIETASYPTRLDASQRALAWYKRASRLMPDAETIGNLAKEAASIKISWEVTMAMQGLSVVIPRIKLYETEAQNFVTNLELYGNKSLAHRGIFTKRGPTIRAEYADQAYQMFLANDARYGEMDVLQFIYDHNPTIRERVMSDVIGMYAAKSSLPNIIFSSSPVRILYNIRDDFFVIFYGVEPSPQTPWVAYTIRINDGDLIDWSHPSRTYFKDRDFDQFSSSNVNTHDGEYVEIPLTPSVSSLGGGKVRGKGKGNGSSTGTGTTKSHSVTSKKSTAKKGN